MKTEKILTLAFIVGLLFKIFHWKGDSVILIISLTLLALIYVPGAFYFFSDKKIKIQNIALSVVSGLFLSLIPIGILFKIMYWPFGEQYLSIALVPTTLLLIITFILKSKSSEELKVYYNNMLKRMIILISIALLFYLTPTETLLKIQYWNDPELARLKTLHYTNPRNEEYKRQHDTYVNKSDSLQHTSYKSE